MNVYAASGGGYGGGYGGGFDVSSIVYAIASFAAANPGDVGTYVYRDAYTGYSVRFDHKDCDCGDDAEKIIAWLQKQCDDGGGVWVGGTDLDKACRRHEPLK